MNLQELIPYLPDFQKDVKFTLIHFSPLGYARKQRRKLMHAEKTWYMVILQELKGRTWRLTDLGLMSTRSWSKFMPGIMMVIFLGPLNPRTFVSCKTRSFLLKSRSHQTSYLTSPHPLNHYGLKIILFYRTKFWNYIYAFQPLYPDNSCIWKIQGFI